MVPGVDSSSAIALEERMQRLLRGAIAELEQAGEVSFDDRSKSSVTEKYRLFGPNDPLNPNSRSFFLPGFSANWGDYSEQNAIDCVAFFIGIMRDAHRFSSRMPTVGGATHVALIRRDDGFKFISREEYRHEDHRVRRANENHVR
jgi:hypothetical protein